MEIADVRVVGKPLVLATPAEVDALARKLWITFADGYGEFVTRLGERILGGSLVRIYPPWRIDKELTGWRRRIGKYWFWDQGRDLLPKDRALECVIIGDTINGDELVFHPMYPKRLFILPCQSERVFEAGSDLLAAIEWICTWGKLVEPFDERNFEPFDSRAVDQNQASRKTVPDPNGESLDDIFELAERWVSRHAVREAAQKELRLRSPKGCKAELVYEGILLDGRSNFEIGYGIAWRLIDKEGGKLLGEFRWRRGDGCQGSEYEPAKKGPSGNSVGLVGFSVEEPTDARPRVVPADFGFEQSLDR